MTTPLLHTRIDGRLDSRANKRHIAHAFTLPPGATVLSIRFDYAPKQSQGQPVRNDLSLTLFDPDGCRGARHNNPDRDLRITARSATPGYTPGALQPGMWTVWIDAHRLLPPDSIDYGFEIDISDAPLTEPAQTWVKGNTAPRGAGWYRGDLHGHTLHSDGHWDVPDFAAYARAYHLDFATLTDHNTVSALAQLDSLAADDLLTMGGEELTTYYGHALALGTRRWLDWRVFPGVTMPTLAEQVERAGALYVIAHPTSVGDPFCTGCDWQYEDMMPGSARCVEIWNSAWGGDSNNEQAVQLWYRWLNQDCRMVATAGTDIHGPMTDPAPGFDVVYARELSEPAILEAIRAGHLYLSAEPRLELTAVGESGAQAMMGDRVSGASITVTAAWSACRPGDHLRLIVDGALRDSTPIEAEGRRAWTLDDGRWCTIEIRGADQAMRAISNPIFMERS